MKRAFSTKEAADYIGTTERTLRASRCPSANVTFNGPTYRRVGTKKIIYLRDDLDSWLDSLVKGEKS